MQRGLRRGRIQSGSLISTSSLAVTSEGSDHRPVAAQESSCASPTAIPRDQIRDDQNDVLRDLGQVTARMPPRRSRPGCLRGPGRSRIRIHAWAMAPEGVTPSPAPVEASCAMSGAAAATPRAAALRSARRAARAAPSSGGRRGQAPARRNRRGAGARVFGVPTIGIDDKLFWGLTRSTWPAPSCAATRGSMSRTGSGKAPSFPG